MPKQYPYYWSMSQPKNILFSYEDSLGCYLVIYQKILEILKVVLESEKIIEPRENLKNIYVTLLEYFYAIQTRDDFKHIPRIRFDKFASLLNIDKNLFVEWKSQMQKYIDYLRLIDGEFKYTRYPFDDVKAPNNLTLLISPLDDELIYHQKLSGSSIKESANRLAELTFTAHKSHKKSVYKILENNKNEWIKKDKMIKNNHLNYNDFRSIISQLRHDIIKQKLSNKLKIESNKKGWYRLFDLAS